MKIVTTRRICQLFFFFLFLWFCVVTTLGEKWWQLRGWPVEWLIQIDPLVGLGTLMTTRTLYKGLLWGLATVILTIVLGRFFCGWICPFGSIHQFIGFLAKRKKSSLEKTKMNHYSRWQVVKYWILIFLLTAAIADTAVYIINLPRFEPLIFGSLIGIFLAVTILLASVRVLANSKKPFLFLALSIIIWAAISYVFENTRLLSASLQIGLLDPIPLVYRSINLVILPLVDGTAVKLFTNPRYYEGTGLIGAIFITAIFLNLKEPRFYCRYICPLGALLGLLSRYSLWRIGKAESKCIDCHLCEKDCEGACSPSTQIKINECILCMNCLAECSHDQIGYRTKPSAAGEILFPDFSKRQFVISILSGAVAVPMIRLQGNLAANWNPQLVRPPGALAEQEFLSRCIKCGQCMRICPTNVIQPAGFVSGVEGLWTPVLNFRIGTSGCQYNCIACGNLCPTAAIRPLSLDERLGRSRYADQGPIKIGTAFVDRGRCLPWAMDIPCIVCQENCPVSPKAIFTREHLNSVNRITPLIVKTADSRYLEIEGDPLEAHRFSSGDYFCTVEGQTDSQPRLILKNTVRSLTISPKLPWNPFPTSGSRVEILIRLQRPFVDPARCIGCGVCEHECPVHGKRAIRVTAENESRSRKHRLLL
jgi:polyferredoxin